MSDEELLRSLDTYACQLREANARLIYAAKARIEALRGEVADALPWKLFYKDGLDLEQIGKRLGKSPYEFSPWLYAPLISQLKDREQTALADPAPAVCEWKQRANKKWRRGCCGGEGWRYALRDCPCCGKPIKFTEAK